MTPAAPSDERPIDGEAARPPLVRFVNVHKAFGAQAVLAGVNLEIPRGRTTVILGPSGSGKSVMLKHVVGLLRPDAGEVYFDGARIDNLSERGLTEVRMQIGFLFQMGALFDSMTIEENVAFPLVEHTRLAPAERTERVRRALQMVDMDGFQGRLPSQLSGGQRKRVALARAVVIEPRLILYDEPTTGLDPVRAEGINDLIVKLQRALGVTSIVVTHDLISARRVADFMVLLLGGRIAAHGRYADLMRSEDPRVREFLTANNEPAAVPEPKPEAVPVRPAL